MRLQFVRELRSIRTTSEIGADFPDFTVLTGPNGSGKSNLLEAINTGAVNFQDFGQLQHPAVRFFAPGQLVAAAENPVQPAAMRDPWNDFYNNVQSWKQQAPSATAGDESAQDQWVYGNAISSRSITADALAEMVQRAQKPLSAMSIADFKMYAPLSRGIKSPFEQSLSELFLTYSERNYANLVAQYRFEKRGGDPALSDEEFLERYGAPPWDLLNEILQVVGLSSYRFDAPPEGVDNVNYEVFLRDQDDLFIRPSELSSGERVLLALATSLHTGVKRHTSIEFPKLLLLDEPDASLHPSMSRSLLTVLQEIFVKQYNVRVLMTTHSPTTVALAPENSLMVMSRLNPRLRAATADEALNYLTVGISTLSVRLENRRQVFVESEYDQSVFQELYKVLKSSLASDRSIEFLAAGKREQGGGCDAVKRLVADLRASGVTSVHGLIDRDDRGGAGDFIHYIADRHSLENLVFDPLLSGAFLLREGIISARDLGLPSGRRHFQLSSSDAQQIADHLASTLSFDQTNVTSVSYVGGFVLQVATEFLETRGHDLEAMVVDRFPQLNRFKQSLKVQIVRLSAADLPAFVPAVCRDLFSAVASAA